MDEGSSYFQIGPSTVQEFKTLQEGPFVFPHDVGGQGACCSALPPHGVHQDRLGGFESFFNEIKDSVGSFVLGIKQ